MRLLFILTSMLLVCSACSEQTILKGHIENYQGNLVTLRAQNIVSYYDTLQVDAAGNFSYVPIAGINQVYMVHVKNYNPQEIPVYLGQGDAVAVNLTLLSDNKMNVAFSGDRVAENIYLQAYRELENSNEWYMSPIKDLNFKDYKKRVEEKLQEMQVILKEIPDSRVRESWNTELHLWAQYRLTGYVSILEGRKFKGEDVKDIDFDDYMKMVDVNNPNECDELVISNIIAWHEMQENEVKNQRLFFLECLDSLLTNQEMKNDFATKKLEMTIRFANGEPLDVLVEYYNSMCTNDSLKSRINTQLVEYQRVYGNLMPGKVALDFEMISDKGEKVSLSDLRGKYVFIDFWATWCAPCVAEIPYMMELQKHFADDSRIALVSVSVDADVNVWQNFLKEKQPTWSQYVVDRKNERFIRKEYRMPGIPRFVLIDPEGRFVSSDFARPSEPMCATMIEQEMNK